MITFTDTAIPCLLDLGSKCQVRQRYCIIRWLWWHCGYFFNCTTLRKVGKQNYTMCTITVIQHSVRERLLKLAITYEPYSTASNFYFMFKYFESLSVGRYKNGQNDEDIYLCCGGVLSTSLLYFCAKTDYFYHCSVKCYTQELHVSH